VNIAVERLQHGVTIYTLHFYGLIEHSTVNIDIPNTHDGYVVL